jgi:hypothetical protein
MSAVTHDAEAHDGVAHRPNGPLRARSPIRRGPSWSRLHFRGVRLHRHPVDRPQRRFDFSIGRQAEVLGERGLKRLGEASRRSGIARAREREHEAGRDLAVMVIERDATAQPFDRGAIVASPSACAISPSRTAAARAPARSDVISAQRSNSAEPDAAKPSRKDRCSDPRRVRARRNDAPARTRRDRR